jgi:hypothetical protein
MQAMNRPTALSVVALFTIIVAGCSSGAAAPQPAASRAEASASRAEASAAASQVATSVAVSSPEQAAALVTATDPIFASVAKKDLDMIGQCCFYEAKAVDHGYQVDVEMGWGDCPSGCINKHQWTFLVTPAGKVELVGQAGDPVPAGGIPAG